MIVAKVIAPVVSTSKHPFLEGRKLLLIKELLDGGELAAAPRIALDFAHAGIGDTVLAQRNGPSMDVLVEQDRAPANLAIIGIVDEVYIGARDN